MVVAAGDAVHPTKRFHFDPRATDAETAAVLRQVIPGLDNPGLDAFARVCLIRKWLSGFVPGADASSAQDLTNRFGVTHHTATLSQLLAWSERREMGMQCGGMAELSRKVFQLLGYESVAINFGDTGSGVSHVTTLVKIPTRHGPEWTIQDTTYNFTLLDGDGLPLGFERLLEKLEARQGAKVQFDHPVDSFQLALYPTGTDPRTISSLAVFSPRLLQSLDGYAAYAMRVSYADIVGRSPTFQALLRGVFGTADPLLLFLLPLSSSGEVSSIELMHRAKTTRDILANHPRVTAQATQ